RPRLPGPATPLSCLSRRRPGRRRAPRRRPSVLLGRPRGARRAVDAGGESRDPARFELAHPVSEPPTVFGVGERDRGKRLDLFMHERIPGLSRARIQRAIAERVTLSWGVRARASPPVRPGGEVRIAYTPIVEEPLNLELDVLARGDGWLAVNKPA